MTGTTVEYNEIIMSDVLTSQWVEDVVYDSSNTDALYIKVTATFTGIIHSSSFTQHLPGFNTGSNDVHTQLDDIRALMMMPRKKLKVDVNQKTIIEVEGIESTQPFGNNINSRPSSSNKKLDLANGPRPLSFHIQAIWGDSVFRVSWTVEACILKFCQGERPEVLSNRWAVSETIDSDKYLTKTINGELRLAAYASVPPFGYKYLVIPPLETGFKRESIDFSVSADLLTARYTIVDKQVEVSAPYPAASFSVTHTERTNSGVDFIAQATAEVVGQPNATLGQLVKRAVQLVFNRLNIDELERNPSSYMITGASITTVQGERIRVICEMGIRLLGGDKNTKVVLSQKSDAAARIVKPIKDLPLLVNPQQGANQQNLRDYDPEVSYPAPDHGYSSDGKPRSPAAAAVLLSYLQTPCDEHQMPTDGRPATSPSLQRIKDSSKYSTSQSTGTRVNDNGTFPSNSTDDPFGRPTTKQMYDKESHKVAYLEVDVQDRWVDNEVKAALPIADTNAEESMIVMRLAKRNSRRLITYRASRVGDLPELPDLPEEYDEPDGGPTLHRMKYDRVVANPRPAPDGLKLIHAITMTAEYAATKPLDDDQKRSLMKYPHLTQNPNAINSLLFSDYTNESIGVKAIRQVSRRNA